MRLILAILLAGIGLHAQSPAQRQNSVLSAPQWTPALKGQAGIAAAYSSARRLSSYYSGPLIRVRRSSDNAELDIPYCWSSVDKEFVLCQTTLLNHVGTYNMLLNSEDATTTGWTTNSSTIAQVAVTNPIGGTTCSRVTANGVNTQHSANAAATTVNTAPVTASVYAKAGTHQFLQIRFSAAIYGGCAVNFDLTNGTYQSMPFGGNTATNIAMTDVGNGWYRCSARTTNNASSGTGSIGFYMVTGLNAASNEPNTLTTNLYIWGAQLQTGSLASYTKTGVGQAGFGYVTTWYDQSGNSRNITQSTAGNQPRVVNAGVLDALNNRQTIIFSGGQSLAIANGFTFTDNAALLVAKQNSPYTTNAGFFQFGATSTNGSLLVEGGSLQMRVASGTGSQTTTDYSGVLRVFGGEWGAALRRLRVDGATVAETSDANTFTASNTSLNIGNLNTTYPLSGAISEAVFMGAAISATNRSTIERNQGKFYGISVQ